MGLFSLSPAARSSTICTAFAGAAVDRRGDRRTQFPAVHPVGGDAGRRRDAIACEDELESIGVNTPEELALVERYLRRRS